MSAPGQFVANNYVYGQDPIRVTCYNCKNEVVTKTTQSINTLCCLLCGCWALCCCQDVEHRCPTCNVVLGQCKET